MKSIFNNIGYFFKEVITIIRLNLLSNVFSLLSTGLIFFILAMIVSGWWASNGVIEAIQGEAEVNVYYNEALDQPAVLQLTEEIKAIDGVRETRLVDKEEAYGRMVEILGKEARVLEHFDSNPFSPYIEVKIYMDKMEAVFHRLSITAGIENIRDNREILNKLQDISAALRVLGSLVIAAVGISTLVIIAHIIRLGIYNNREQINTLRLLGAPEAFVAFPFLLVGLLINLGGGLIASVLTAFSIDYVYAQLSGPLPFIPLPPQEMLISSIIILIIPLSAALGIMGSLFGLSSAKAK